MGDHSKAFHLVEVLLDLWAQGDVAFPQGVSQDEHHVRVGSCIHQGIYQFL